MSLVAFHHLSAVHTIIPTVPRDQHVERKQPAAVKWPNLSILFDVSDYWLTTVGTLHVEYSTLYSDV